MWKIIKEDSDDLEFAIKCLFSQSIDLNEFKLWIEQVIRDMPIEDIPFYIFDLADFNGGIGDIDNIVGFVSSYSLSKSKKNALTGIAFLRGIDVYDPPISKEKALKALKKHPEIYHKFKRFFPFVELPLL
ncbi:TPA: hypothetical protein WLE37_000466 [Neisseria gonorrhoeae]|uniref:hypothetical protein n=1 Tax=Neisseria gonorrhoeae TaxID=485 RepID=UPI0001BC9412|nr:hypothetical protein [Neisseria gonorrhoeae]AZG22193.1 hypothetical protein EGH14_01440 [Neisseria gonorrhoeae]AZG29090.1 hypothetical protein EGH20_01440 [Neisseria gonorrhoeae]AZG69199.1 hypothetical protein EGH16_01435 [Neisseria gonorrhoeae]EFE03333.1 conserved hypothetical protein [Neisseria gonorrhoeae DGI2]KLR78078.1 hypothetical protein M717_03280 [Neisseria gonorrhoeae SK33414]